MSVRIIGGCDKCGLTFNNSIDYNKKYQRWENIYFFGLFKFVYKEESLCNVCKPIIEKEFSIESIRKRKIKKFI